jgi:beta-lactamase regulating signal transducer with metallopeptidase domain
MKLLLEVSQSPVLEMLLKWTVLLALGWAAHGLLRSKDARWRLILWRGIFCFGLALPVVQLFPISVVKIPIHDYADNAPETSAAVPRGADYGTMEVGTERPIMATVTVPAGRTLDTEVRPIAKVAATIPWRTMLITIWAVGGIYGAIRLVRLMVHLSVLKRNARPAGEGITALASEILQRLRVRRVAQVLLSDSAVSPFVFGVFKPTIMLPGRLVESLSQAEAAALLGHEIAHLRQNDLFWCVGWRWMKAVFWFHPLVWKIPAAHNLACEEEADRLASCQMGEIASYPRILAQLALRVLDIPKVETQLTANGTAQISQRLRHLGLNLGTWKRKHTYAACGMVLALVLVSAGCKFTQTKDGDKTGNDAASISTVETNKQTYLLTGIVTDSDDKPVAGATVQFWSDSGNGAYARDPALRKEVVTDANGQFKFKAANEAGVLVVKKRGLAYAWDLVNPSHPLRQGHEYKIGMTPPGTISGMVVDESDQPVTNIEVSATMATYEIIGPTVRRSRILLTGKIAHDCFAATTDATGHFHIDNFPTNATAELTVQLPGKALRPAIRKSTNQEELSYCASQEEIKLVMEPTGSIEGRIASGETNQPPTMAWLKLQSTGTGWFNKGWRLAAQANADGTFRINDVPAGVHRIHTTFGTNANSDWVAEQVAVSVKAGQTNRGLEVIATHGGMLEVVVLGKKDHKPLSEFYVSAYKQSFQSEATTDSNGTARLRLSPGDYQVTAANQSTSGYRRSVKVETGRTNRIEIEVAHPNKISGIVRMPDGQPAVGLAIRIVGGVIPGKGDFKTDANGKFEQVMTKRRFGSNEVKMYLLIRDVEHNLAVLQDVDDETDPFDIKLAPALTLAGRAKSGGKPITNVTAKLVFFCTDHEAVVLKDVAKTNISGHYEILALPPGGKYGVVVAAPGYGEKNVPEFKASTEAIRQELETVELKPANLRIAGQVLDVDDKPVANFYVRLFGGEQPSTRVPTDREGRFIFEHTCEGAAGLTTYFNNSGGYFQTKGGDTNVVFRLKLIP